MDIERREFNGGVIKTDLSAGISNVALSIPVTNGSTFPDGSHQQFVIVVNRGDVSEEKILCSSRTGNTITAVTRGYDGTTPSAHLSADPVDHVLDATAMQAMNDAAFDTMVLTWMGI